MGKIYQQLSIEERTMIQTQLEMGIRPAAIALGLNRSASTLSRELRRNGWARPKARRYPGRPPVAGGYRAQAAHKRAHACTVRARVARRLRPGAALWDQVIHYLKAGYSPEQIAGTLTLVNSETPTLQVSHETIYTAIYAMPRGELRTEVIGWLRFGHAKRRPRARGEDRRGQIPDRVSIHDRPPEVEERLVPGHWEGDLILGLGSSAIGTLVERMTRFILLLHLPRMEGHGSEARIKNGPALAGHGAEAVRDAITHTITRLPEQLRRSLTWDQGAEMSQHGQLRVDTGIQVYFCDPQSPWQRGSNENTNGLLRQYFPKGTDLSVNGPEELAAVATALNTRPRKTLSWRTPAEAFDEVVRMGETNIATTA